MAIGTSAKHDQFNGEFIIYCFHFNRFSSQIFSLSFRSQRCIQVLLDHAVSLLHRPKHLKRLINSTASLKDVQNVADDDSFDDIVKTMNVYVFLFLFSFETKCFIAFKLLLAG